MREITREELDRCIRHCGADENLQSVLAELDAEEIPIKASQLLRRVAVDEQWPRLVRGK